MLPYFRVPGCCSGGAGSGGALGGVCHLHSSVCPALALLAVALARSVKAEGGGALRGGAGGGGPTTTVTVKHNIFHTLAQASRQPLLYTHRLRSVTTCITQVRDHMYDVSLRSVTTCITHQSPVFFLSPRILGIIHTGLHRYNKLIIIILIQGTS